MKRQAGEVRVCDEDHASFGFGDEELLSVVPAESEIRGHRAGDTADARDRHSGGRQDPHAARARLCNIEVALFVEGNTVWATHTARHVGEHADLCYGTVRIQRNAPDLLSTRHRYEQGFVGRIERQAIWT